MIDQLLCVHAHSSLTDTSARIFKTGETNIDHEASIQAAQAIIAEHIAALNARDEARLAATLHFPHYRLSGANLKCWDTPLAYFSDFRARAGNAWSHSAADDIRVLAASSNKVHLDVAINRFDMSGALIASFRSLWVMTRTSGVWAAQFRSSFAEK